jgi:hypothetical protein
MKKLLVLALVLSMATMANAALTLQINVSGGIHNPDGSITMAPSDHLVIGITTPMGILVDEDQGDFIMVASTQLASVSGGVINNALVWWGNGLANDAAGAGAPVPEGTNGVWGGVYLFGYVIPAASTLFSEIDFHCEAIGDTTLTIYSHDWGTTTGTLSEVVIHQIPEPITLSLLGLGGLFLRRRK